MSARKRVANNQNGDSTSDNVTPPHHSADNGERLPLHSGGIQSAGESGRRGFHPLQFLMICFRSSSRVSMAVNVLWPAVIVMMVVNYTIGTGPEPDFVAAFTTAYIGMIPAANTIGFAGQELARKLPHVFGVILEVTLGSIVEIVLFSILVSKGEIVVVRAAILGSILANLLLCLGCCFIAGGFSRHEQKFHEAVSEVGSGLMLVAAFGLVLPSIFAISATSDVTKLDGVLKFKPAEHKILQISRGASIILILAYFVYIYFNMRSHHGLMTEIFEGDEERDRDRHEDMAKKKLTLTECVIALAISITFVTFAAVFLVNNIEPIVTERNVPDAFLGLILVPLVEKLSEHLTAIDEAYDDQANLALAHVLGASLQTALLNTPIVVFVGWGLGVSMDLNFKQFEAIVLILTIVVVGNFLRDGKSNYLEGVLCVFVYVLIALCAFVYPNPDREELYEKGGLSPESGGGGAEGGTPAEFAVRMLTGRL